MTAAGAIAVRSATAADAAAVAGLLESAGLPRDGLDEWLPHFWLAEQDGRLAGVAGLELYREGALLRSVAVDPDMRGLGIGRRLSVRAIEAALAAGSPAVYLLTTSAEHYFPRLGFVPVTRAEVPESVQQSVEFQGACPASAVIMRRTLR